MVEDGDTQEESDARLKRRVKNIIDANENAQQILSLLEPFSADDTKTAVEATISCSSYYVALYLYENNVSSEDFILNNPESYLIYNLLRNFEVGVYNPEDSKFRLVKR
jgi:hypothetical protein